MPVLVGRVGLDFSVIFLYFFVETEMSNLLLAQSVV